MLKNRAYLLGFMGCGKSFIGAKFAAELDWALVDLDEMIASEAELSIPEIFQTKGEEWFRKLEKECLHKTKHCNKTIIALGGGTPCFFDNMDWILNNGTSFFLDTPIEILVQRLLPEQDKRPLLKGKNENELRDFIQEKIIERRPFYEQANYVLTKPNDFINEIKNKL